MTKADQIDEDGVLRRMLTTPPAKHKPLSRATPRKPVKAKQGR